MVIRKSAEIRGKGSRRIRTADLPVDPDTADEHLVLMHQLFAEYEVGHRAGKGTDREEDHAPRYPLRTMALTAVIGQQEGRTDLPYLGRRHYYTGCLRLNLKQLLYRRYHRHEVRVVHPLQNLLNKKNLLINKRQSS